MPKAYKVFKKLKDGTLVSAGNIPQEFRICYSRTKINIPKIPNSKFFCFISLDKAIDFRKNNAPKSEIWIVDAENISKNLIKQLPKLWTISQGDIKSIENYTSIVDFFWKRGFKISGTELGNTVEGVHTVSSIKLIEKIYD